jgi:hypothetical protein
LPDLALTGGPGGHSPLSNSPDSPISAAAVVFAANSPKRLTIFENPRLNWVRLQKAADAAALASASQLTGDTATATNSTVVNPGASKGARARLAAVVSGDGSQGRLQPCPFG